MMKSLLNLKTRTKLITGFLLVTILVAVVGFYGIVNMKNINDRMTAMYKNNLIPIQLLSQISENETVSRVEILNLFVYTDQNSISTSINNIDKLTNEDDSLLKQYEATNLTDEEKTLLKNFKADAQNYRAVRTQIVELIKSSNQQQALSLMNEVKTIREKSQKDLDDLISLNEKVAAQTSTDGDVTFSSSYKFMLTLIVFSIILAISLGILLSQIIVSSLKKGVKFAKSIAEGDLTQKLDIKSKDEFGELAAALNKAMRNTDNLIKTLNESIGSISASSQELSATSEEISAQVQNVTAAVEEISSGMEETSASTEELSASEVQIKSAIDEISKKAIQAEKQADEIDDRAKKIMQQADDALNTEQTMYSSTKAEILSAIEAGKVVEEVKKMSEAISSIAGQTNLLALNAAIEAARAGDQGKGFAVVADEVRKLAEESAETVQSIQQVIEKVEDAFKNLSNSATSVLAFIDDRVTSDYNDYKNVGVQYKKDADMIDEMANAISARSSEIAASMQQFNRALESVAATIEETSASGQAISGDITEVSDAVEGVVKSVQVQAELGEKLMSLVGRFKV